MVSSVGSSSFDYSSIGLGVDEPTKKKELGQDEFMQLMLTQLKNQDPMKPMESGEFLGQLAQFGTVQGLAGLQTSFDGLSTSLVSNQALQAASLVGKSALVAASSATITQGQQLNGAIDLPASSGSVRLQIHGPNGNVVRTVNLGQNAAGLAQFHWDGTLDDGSPAPAGKYSFVADFQNGNKVAAADTLIEAPVQSVVFGKDGFTVALGGLGELPFSSIREIRND